MDEEILRESHANYLGLDVQANPLSEDDLLNLDDVDINEEDFDFLLLQTKDGTGVGACVGACVGSDAGAGVGADDVSALSSHLEQLPSGVIEVLPAVACSNDPVLHVILDRKGLMQIMNVSRQTMNVVPVTITAQKKGVYCIVASMTDPEGRIFLPHGVLGKVR